ncbi:putative hydroxymethylpyrimidine transport system permease protein [Rhizobium soli]|uniref:Putative hydroxymethylpyrimidine transport system permease protein n=1 Tax=Rhizobium soli TaxID=424798 RepID=A0A7X0JMT6_9HYPH|nr:ABC transporter permease [Rhizobium soli]MBB6510105.1 putative hydroxymethylpyrimidine transport system permease protein [Rhizobium soli]
MQSRFAALGLFLLLVSWQLAVQVFSPPRYLLPSPLAVVQALVGQSGFLAHHTLVTLSEILAGLIAGSIFGAAVAFLVVAFPRAGRLAWPIILILQTFPVFVLAPILVLWLGFGMASKVMMTTLVIFFPVASAFADGLRRTEPAILEAAALTRATPWQILVRLRTPLALPALVSGLRVAVPLAPLGAVIGEWVGASAGLGFVMVQANARMQTDTVFAAMTILALTSVALRLGFDRLVKGRPHWATETEQQTQLSS